MIVTPPTLTIPLRADEDGSIRVGRTRVLFHLVIRAYQHGETAEGIIEMYDSLSIGDVYAVLAYYHANREQVDMFVQAIVDEEARIIDDYFANLTPQERQFRQRLVAALELKRYLEP